MQQKRVQRGGEVEQTLTSTNDTLVDEVDNSSMGKNLPITQKDKKEDTTVKYDSYKSSNVEEVDKTVTETITKLPMSNKILTLK
eukprot:15340318-Ditylum_brightwellii.AAC.1